MLKTVWDITNEEFIKIVNESKNYTEIMKKCGYTNVGNTATIKKRITLLNLTVDHFVRNITNNLPIPAKRNLEDILINNIKHNNTYLKKRLINELHWEYKCKECGITDWNNKKISLELDHINGINTDNKIDNLRLLCPNCHSQTPTFRAKNKQKQQSRECTDCLQIISQTNKSGYCAKCAGKYRKSLKDKPSLEELENDMKELKTYVAVGKKHNVSDNCIRKWIKKYNQKELQIENLFIYDITL